MKVLPEAGTNIRDTVVAINQLMRGRSNAVSQVTLAAGVTTTIVTGDNFNADAEVFLFPRTANAAAALATTYGSVTVAGTVTITHANAGTTDRTFALLVIGG